MVGEVHIPPVASKAVIRVKGLGDAGTVSPVPPPLQVHRTRSKGGAGAKDAVQSGLGVGVDDLPVTVGIVVFQYCGYIKTAPRASMQRPTIIGIKAAHTNPYFGTLNLLFGLGNNID